MYQDDYKRWMEADLEDADLKPELARIEENDEEIKERFAVKIPKMIPPITITIRSRQGRA